MILSVIIPAYNCQIYLNPLIEVLQSQLSDETEVIVIDDGSKTPISVPKECTLIRKTNGGAASARNAGIDSAKGEYIAFIDADDMVREDYIEILLKKIKDEKPDYIYLSWETFGKGWDYKVSLKSIDDEFPPFNLCCWNRVYKRSLIGSTRFNENKAIAEDAQFIREVETKGKKKAFIPESIYFYRTDNEDSLTHKFSNGTLNMKRVVYNLPVVTEDMKYLLEETKELDKDSEVIIMTNRNEIPELARHAMIIKPQRIAGTELRGEQTNLFKQIPKPFKTQVVIYIGNAFNIGGVETWIYNFCANMHKFYDIMVLYDKHYGPEQIARLSQIVLVHKNMGRSIACDTLLNMRITDKPPKNVIAKQIIQVCHTCRMKDWKIQPEYDKLIYVSDTARKSFTEDGEVIYNMTYFEKPKRILKLVSATRLTFEKGEMRMLKFAEGLRARNIPFVWFVFTDRPLERKVDGIIEMLPTLDVRSYVQDADYLVQLSDCEAFCYSLVESLELGTPVITTPIEVLKELQIEDRVHGYIVPFDMKEVPYEEIYNEIPKITLQLDNEFIQSQWKKILGKTRPKEKTESPTTTVRILEDYGDMELGRNVKEGEVIAMRTPRAYMLIALGKAEVYIGT